MVVTLSVALGVSIVGMVSLLSLKRYELSSGRVLFSSVRPPLRTFFHSLSVVIEKYVPFLVRDALKRARAQGLTFLHFVLAHTVIAVEGWLERVLHTVKEKTKSSRIPGEASPFLREVAEHKRQLLRDNGSRRSIED